MSIKDDKVFIKAKEVAGELFDLTITSTNNIFGKVKYDYALKNGISMPLHYYISELKKIVCGEIDSKFYKRAFRLNILKECNKLDDILLINAFQDKVQESFKELFKILTNYLNGGDGINDLNAPLLFIVSGGNILTIYYYIIQLIINNEKNNKILDLFPENLKETIEQIILNIQIINLDIIENKKKEEEIVEKKLYEKLKEKFNLIKISFSDLDFTLVPNKKEKIEEYLNLKKGGTRRSDAMNANKRRTEQENRIKQEEIKKQKQIQLEKQLEKQLQKKILKEHQEKITKNKQKFEELLQKALKKTQKITLKIKSEDKKLNNNTKKSKKIRSDNSLLNMHKSSRRKKLISKTNKKYTKKRKRENIKTENIKIKKTKKELLYNNFEDSDQGFYLLRIKTANKFTNFENTDNEAVNILIRQLYTTLNNYYILKKEIDKKKNDNNLCELVDFNNYTNITDLKIDDLNISKLNKNSFFDLIGIEKKNFIPHLYNSNWNNIINNYINKLENLIKNEIDKIDEIDEVKLENLNRLLQNFKNCKLQINLFEIKKNITKIGTDMNIEMILSIITNNSNDLYDKIKNLINYLHNLSKNINIYILDLFNKKFIEYNNYEEIERNYSNLKNIIEDNSKLRYLSNLILYKLLENNKTLIDNINKILRNNVMEKKIIISGSIKLDNYNNIILDNYHNIKLLSNYFITNKVYKKSYYDPDDNSDIEKELDITKNTLTTEEIQEIEDMNI